MGEIKTYHLRLDGCMEQSAVGQWVQISEYKKLKAKLKKISKALDYYGKHQPLCGVLGGYGQCSCGLELALEQLKESK